MSVLSLKELDLIDLKHFPFKVPILWQNAIIYRMRYFLSKFDIA